MIVVSGCPRSGTSLMMDLFRVALGDDRIIGRKWPQDPRPGSYGVQACADYLKDKQNPEWRKQSDESKAMNPNGFYECRWTVRGIQYAAETPDPGSVVKIVSQGIANSNPAYVDKLVYMVRHPWAVAKSQRDLVLPLPIHARKKDVGGSDPSMYIQVTARAAAWIQQNNPDLLMVNFDGLIGQCDETLEGIANFIGEGDWTAARQQIEPKLNRSEPDRGGDGDVWEVAMKMHQHLLRQDWQAVIDAAADHANNQPKTVQFKCPRWGGVVNETMCRNCQSSDEIRGRMRKTADRRRIAWWDEPCLWECGMNPDPEFTPLTIDQSVEQNHWVKPGLGTVIEKLAKKLGVKPCIKCNRRKRKMDAATS